MNEKKIRSCLVDYLSKKHDLVNTIFIKELFVNNFACRADLVMANGQLSVFEIKSKLDSLDRLPNQIENYIKAFENITVVCAQKHLDKVLSQYQSPIGVWLIEDDGKIVIKRRSSRLKKSSSEWLRHIPIDELRLLLKSKDLYIGGNREFLVKEAAQKICTKEIRDFVLSYFKRREDKILKRKKIIDKNSSVSISNKTLTHSETFIDGINLVSENIQTILPRKTLKNPNPRPILLQVS